MSHDPVTLIGYASDIGGPVQGTAQGPSWLKDSSYFKEINIDKEWETILQPNLSFQSKLEIIHALSEELSFLTARCALEKKFFAVLGGDHTAAIGTWSGVSHAKQDLGPIGLIWIDAHLDSHTPATSQSGNIHGMPLACLLGHGAPELTQIFHPQAKILPENLCIIGVRSYEQGELDLLNKLNVRIYFMEEVKERGIKTVLAEAREIVNRNTVCYGLTLDIDSIDPEDAPGTGVAEKNGIRGKELCQALTIFSDDAKLIGIELVEFDPVHDKDQKTEKLVSQLFAALTLGKYS